MTAETAAALAPATPGSAPRRAIGLSMLRRVLRRPLGALCVAWLLAVTLGSFFASAVAPYGPLEQDLVATYSGPSASHWLGADQLGRDILSRILHGGQVSLPAVLEAVAVFVAMGLGLGLLAGYAGGATERLVMRVCDMLMSIPIVVILLVVLAVFSRNETAAMITFGFLASAGLARVVRASTIEVRAEQFVTAAVTAGMTPLHVLRRHVLPRVAGPVIIQAALLAGSALLVESGLNYLGLGIQPPAPSWGGLVADASQAIDTQPWLLVPSGAVIVLTALALGLLGDVVRDLSADPTLAGRTLSWRAMQTRVLRTRSDATDSPADNRSDAAYLAGQADHAGRSLLSVRDLTVTVGDTTLVDRVTLDVRRGETLGLVGESGCGKTMTVSGLLRLLPPEGTLSAQEYTFDGEDLLALDEPRMGRVRGTRIGYIAQEPVAALDPSFTVGRQLGYVVRQHTGLRGAALRARVLELLGLVRLPDPAAVARKHPHELSGGMAQRVAIARALAGQPDLLIADEPTTALDVTVQAEILDLLRDLQTTMGMALIIVTHDWGVVADICDRAMVMYAGQVVESATVADIFAAPSHPYTAALLAANPHGSTPMEPLAAIPGQVPAPGTWPTGCRFQARCALATEACGSGPVPVTLATSGSAVRCLHPLTATTATTPERSLHDVGAS